MIIGGNTLDSAFINCAYGMIDYMADRESFEADPEHEVEFRVSGKDDRTFAFPRFCRKRYRLVTFQFSG